MSTLRGLYLSSTATDATGDAADKHHNSSAAVHSQHGRLADIAANAATNAICRWGVQQQQLPAFQHACRQSQMQHETHADTGSTTAAFVDAADLQTLPAFMPATHTVSAAT
jgi:hypothetical protein